MLAAIAERDPDALGPARAIATWMRRCADRVAFNASPSWGWMGAVFRHDGVEIAPLRLHTDATTAVYFEYMLGKPVFGDLGRRQALLDRLNAVPGVRLPPDAVSKHKGIPLASFTPETIAAFLAAMDWFVAEPRPGSRACRPPRTASPPSKAPTLGGTPAESRPSAAHCRLRSLRRDRQQRRHAPCRSPRVEPLSSGP